MTRSRNHAVQWIENLVSRLAGGLNCREFRTFVLEYFEGELPTREAWMFDRHLSACPECLTYLTAYGTSMAVGAASNHHPEAPVPQGVPENLVSAIMAARARRGV